MVQIAGLGLNRLPLPGLLSLSQVDVVNGDQPGFSLDPNLVAKAKEELTTTKSDIPLVINDYVASFINFFANSPRGPWWPASF